MRSLSILIVSTVLTVGCDAGPVSPTRPAGLSAALENQGAVVRQKNRSIVHVPFFITDANGLAPAAASTPLYEIRAGNPIIAPDGKQITLGEFNAVQGSATASCVRGGTHVVVRVIGLVPKGLYTVWMVVFKAPGFDPTFANVIGLGAIGASDGSQNVFRASASGEGTISAITPEGSLSTAGAVSACALAGEFEFHIVGAYHIDGHTYGPVLGPAGSAVEQFGFIFKR